MKHDAKYQCTKYGHGATCLHEACRPEGPVSGELHQLFPDAQERPVFTSLAEAAAVVATCAAEMEQLSHSAVSARRSIASLRRALERDVRELADVSRVCQAAVDHIAEASAQ